MAEFRKVHTKIWEDDWFYSLPLDGKILFLYIITNRFASIAGIYKLPMRYITMETGISSDRVSELLTEFRKAGKAEYEDGIIWVKNMRRYQSSDSPKVQIAIDNDIYSIPNCPLKKRYLEYHMDTVSIEYPYSNDTVSPTETETETKTETKRVRRTSCVASAAQTPPPPSSSTKTQPKRSKPKPEAVQFVDSIVGKRLISAALYARVESIIAAKRDPPFLRLCYETWLARGYNPKNLAWLFEWYANGRIPEGRSPPSPNGQETYHHEVADIDEWNNAPTVGELDDADK